MLLTHLLQLFFLLRRQDAEHLLVRLLAKLLDFLFLLIVCERTVLADRSALLPHIFVDLLELGFLRVSKAKFLGQHRHVLALALCGGTASLALFLCLHAERYEHQRCKCRNYNTMTKSLHGLSSRHILTLEGP